MKYDFSTYLKHALNEAEKQSVYSKGKFNTTDTDEIEDWLRKRKDSLKVSKENKLIYTNDEGKKINLTDNNKDVDLVKIYKEIRSTSTDKGVVKSYNKDTFEKLGETYAYRATVCFTIMSQSDFKDMTNDVFENDPDNVLLQINDLQSYFDFAAACTTVSHKLNKEEKDSESAKLATQCKELLDKPETRFQGIEKVKKEIQKDFIKYHDTFSNAFDNGMKEQQKKMTEKDYKWVDPSTGLPPKGFSQKFTKIAGQGAAKLAELGSKFADKVKNSPHNLENDIARAAVIGVKMIAVGVHGLGNLLRKFISPKGKIYKYVTSKTVDKKINEFKPKYEEAKKGNYLPSQIKKESTEEDKKKCEQFKHVFQSLMYDELIPMYYKQVQVFSECYLNLNDKYILKQTKDGWQTKQTESGKYTELWNAVLLLKEHIDKCDKFFKSLNLYDEFKDSKMELFLGSVEKNTPNEYQQSILDWFDKINTEETDVEKVDALKRIANIYTKDIMLPYMSLNSETFAQYKDKLSKSLQALNVIKEIPVVIAFKIKFKTDDLSTKVNGIIPLKEEKTEEENKDNDVDEEQFNKEYKAIENDLKELTTNNKLEVINDKITDINDKSDTTLNQLKDMVSKMDNIEDDIKKKFIAFIETYLKKKSVDKIFAIRALMTQFKLTECTSLNAIMNILNEDVNAEELNTLKKELVNAVSNTIDLNKVETIVKNFNEKVEKIYNELDDETKKKLENYKDDGLKLLYAIIAITNKPNPEEKTQTHKG